MGALKDTLADFLTPSATLGEGLSLDRRPGAITFDFLESHSSGPVALADASQGLVARAWRVSTREPGSVHLAPASEPYAAGGGDAWAADALLFSYTGVPIVEVDLAFDQLGAPVVTAERHTGPGGAAEIWLYRYDPVAATYTFTAICDGWSPRIVLDDPHGPAGESDVVLLYVSESAGGGTLRMRRQRDLYAVALDTPVEAEGLCCEDVALAANNRLAVLVSIEDGGRYALATLESAPYPHRMGVERLSALQRVGEMGLVDVMLGQDALDRFQASQRVGHLTLVELNVFLRPEGPDFFFAAEKFRPTQRVGSLTLQELVLRAGMDADWMQSTQRVQSFAVVESQLVVPNAGIGRVQPTHRVSSLALVAV